MLSIVSLKTYHFGELLILFPLKIIMGSWKMLSKITDGAEM